MIPEDLGSPGVPGVDLGRVWIHVASRVWARPAGRVERAARRLLGSAGLARALVTTPSLLLSWLLASAAVLAVGAVASASMGTPMVPLLAPAVAGVGIAHAYGPGTDPAAELTASMPIGARMVLLTRSVAVFAVNALLGIAASMVAPAATGITLWWLIPMTTVSSLALAAATVARSANVGVVIALAGWSIAVLGGDAATGWLWAAASSPALMIPYLALTVVCAGVALGATGVTDRQERGLA